MTWQSLHLYKSKIDHQAQHGVRAPPMTRVRQEREIDHFTTCFGKNWVCISFDKYRVQSRAPVELRIAHVENLDSYLVQMSRRRKFESETIVVKIADRQRVFLIFSDGRGERFSLNVRDIEPDSHRK